MCRVPEVGVNLPEKTYRYYDNHISVTFYCSPFERCSVYFKRDTSVIGHRSEFYCLTVDKVKFVLVSRQKYVISRSTLPLLSLSDSPRAESSFLLGRFDP